MILTFLIIQFIAVNLFRYDPGQGWRHCWSPKWPDCYRKCGWLATADSPVAAWVCVRSQAA